MLLVEGGKETGNIHQSTDDPDKPAGTFFKNWNCNLNVVGFGTLIVAYIGHSDRTYPAGIHGLPMQNLPRTPQAF